MFVCTILLLQFAYFAVKYTPRGTVDSWFCEWHSDMPGLFDALICLKYLSYYRFKIYFSDLFLPLLMEFWVYFLSVFLFLKKRMLLEKNFKYTQK